ncbi:MAG TPA: substrate-binding domain-containing protein, partial [Candidatus Eisenbacteria bacterium]|nr:substrate-binding domain-containing protein [Candidatus Eisenbacteria bacterium]
MSEPSSSKLTWAGKLFVLLFVAGCLYGAYYLFARKPIGNKEAAPVAVRESDEHVRIGIAYGTEKERWMEWAVAEFAKSDEGEGIGIELIPMGSLEGAQAVLGKDERIHVWSPASALYKDVFLQEWQVRQGGGNPIAREENLALTPMVFVMWAERYAAFQQKYGEISFRTLSQALAEPSGWQTIANKPEWGLFKLGHTHPNQSNSGLMTLVLMAYDYHQKNRGLTLQDILDPGFVTWLRDFERAVTGLSNSTGNLMREMVLKGPSAYDAVVVYESVAIDYLKNAEGRWGELRVVYPVRNAWNENPYYVLDVPWSSAEQREAAGKF